jgi:ubiquinol-cytochrome c reductase cytochrome b subunit
LFLVPWLDRGRVKSVRYRGRGFKIGLGLFAVSFLMLGAVGAGLTSEYIPHFFGPTADVTTIENAFGRFWLFVYLASFVALWAYTYFGWEKTKPVPERVTTHD